VPATAAQPRPADNAHDEAWLATKELFVAAMSSMVPGSEDLAGRCFDEGVGLLSEKLFDLGFRDSTRIQVDAAVAKLVDWLRPRLATLAGLSSAAGGPEKLVDESRRAVEQKIAVDLRRAHPPPTAAERRLNDRLRDSTKPGGER
jgi:hypothetical protein